MKCFVPNTHEDWINNLFAAKRNTKHSDDYQWLVIIVYEDLAMSLFASNILRKWQSILPKSSILVVILTSGMWFTILGPDSPNATLFLLAKRGLRLLPTSYWDSMHSLQTQWQFLSPSTRWQDNHISDGVCTCVLAVHSSVGSTKTNLGMKPAVICKRRVSKSLIVVTNCVHFAVLVRGSKCESKLVLKWPSGGRITINRFCRSTPFWKFWYSSIMYGSTIGL